MPQITLALQSEAQHKQTGECIPSTLSPGNHIRFTTALRTKEPVKVSECRPPTYPALTNSEHLMLLVFDVRNYIKS